MNNIKMFFLSFTVAFAILALTKALSTDIAMPIMLVSLAITMLISSKEYNDKGRKRAAGCFLLIGIFLIMISVYNVAAIIWSF